jgi:hypothetical protein
MLDPDPELAPQYWIRFRGNITGRYTGNRYNLMLLLQAELGGRIEEEDRLRQELTAAQQVIQAQRKELDR